MPLEGIDDLLDVQETSEILKTTVGVVRCWIHNGKLPVTRFGRRVYVIKSELFQMLEKRQNEGR